MARRYGRAPRGERVVAAIPHGHWKTTTFIAALRHDRITAPCVCIAPGSLDTSLSHAAGLSDIAVCHA